LLRPALGVGSAAAAQYDAQGAEMQVEDVDFGNALSPCARVSTRRALIEMSPKTPQTPQQPLWLTRCENAQARCPFRTQFCLRQGSKGEDRLTVSMRPGGSGDVIWAVFDGHCGGQRSGSVAGFAAQSVPDLVWNSALWPSNPTEAIRQALQDCHEQARRDRLEGGSTAVVLASTGGKLWCGFAGDSRAVARLHDGTVRPLSSEHLCTLEDEILRIKAAGADLEWGKVGGVLPMTRGIGNFGLEREGFACLPEVRSVLRSEVDFVVVGSDGLWDVIGSQECCEIVRTSSASDKVANRIAETLAEEASRRWTNEHRTPDDIAVIVVFFASDMDAPSPMCRTPQLERIVAGEALELPITVPFAWRFGGMAQLANFGLSDRPPPVVRELPFSSDAEDLPGDMN